MYRYVCVSAKESQKDYTHNNFLKPKILQKKFCVSVKKLKDNKIISLIYCNTFLKHLCSEYLFGVYNIFLAEQTYTNFKSLGKQDRFFFFGTNLDSKYFKQG